MEIRLDDLRESNEFLNILIDNIVSAIFIVDKNVNIQNVNNSFEVFFQKPSDEIIGELFGNAVGCSYAVNEKKDCGLTESCNSCTLRFSVLNAFIEKVPVDKHLLVRDFYIKGEKILKYYQFSTRYIQYKGEEMVLIIVDDITERQVQKIQLEEQNEKLKLINEEKNKILGIAAHDIRSPLAIVSSYAAFLSDKNMVVSEEMLSKYLKIIYDRSNFGLELLDDILDFSKIESGEINLQTKEIEFISFVQKTVDFNRVLAKRKNQEIKLQHNINEIFMAVDTFKIEQVLNNLLSNAMKFSQENSDITVQIEKSINDIKLSVTDLGPGVPEKEIDIIFKPFQTSSVQPTSNEKSTGLGLAISRKIIEAHNGQIGIYNNKENGATFYFVLPLQ